MKNAIHRSDCSIHPEISGSCDCLTPVLSYINDTDEWLVEPHGFNVHKRSIAIKDEGEARMCMKYLEELADFRKEQTP